MKIRVILFLIFSFFSCKEVQKENEELIINKEFVTDNDNKISKGSDVVINNDRPVNNLNQLEGETLSGWLKLGLSEKKILNELGDGFIMGKQEYSQVDGEYYQSWDYEEKGISLVMRVDAQESAKIVAEIKLTYPCNMTTSHGIRIGSSEEEVYNQYKGNISKEDSNKEIVVIGNIYEGVFFMLKESKVTGIIIGSMAE
ncbi:hypothetical protein GN157_06315 [Flavobacterium rakeshii]|uniref:Uncharacterized protein n=1 Tax=Flavobacterium rakeshii TaxID=1038845 RepID=A0A6N8HBS2_9FLAO|nr:hypothetical protein [Flavobacterium rakeshii]MUV03320.1 hypothetical protein [Flavobacterium rakeshii]